MHGKDKHFFIRVDVLVEEGRGKKKERSFTCNCNIFISLNVRGSISSKNGKIYKHLLYLDGTHKNVKYKKTSRIHRNIYFSTLSYVLFYAKIFYN